MYKYKKVFAIIVAAGKGTRIGFDKMLYKIDGIPVIEKSIKAFDDNVLVDEIIVVAGDNIAQVKQISKGYKKVVCIVKGGKERAESVINGLEQVNGEALVAVHDGARPFVSQKIITDAITSAYTHKAAIPCVAVKDTIKSVVADRVEKSLQRDKLYIAQTPQVFDAMLYKKLLSEKIDITITDDAQLFENAGYNVAVCQGSYENYKITTIEDIQKEKKMRVGHGYDVHRLVEGRKLILGGVEIEYEKGLLGHSDADVLVHAIMDAILGALALGDIGKHFPDSDERYKGASSIYLLECVRELAEQKGANIQNVDSTVLCQEPKLAKHIEQMRKNIATALHISLERVSVKATTEEGLGFTGQKQGIAAHSVCVVDVQ